MNLLRKLLTAFGLCMGVTAVFAARPPAKDDDVVLMPRFEVNETKFGPWIHATCDGFEILSDRSDARTKSFAVDFAAFLHFTRQVCPELLLPEGTKLTVILAGPERFAELVPTFPSPLGYSELPWGVLARTQDTAVIAMRYEGVPTPRPNRGRDDAARDTLINAQATYFNDPALVAHRKVLREGPGPGTLFTTAVGESRPFLASRQPFLKTGVITVVAGMASASGGVLTFHDQTMRWEHYFGAAGGIRDPLDPKLPVKTLPPLQNLFAIDVETPAWGSPLHRLERDAFVHWALLANGPQRARVFLDFLSKAGAEPPSTDVFEKVFGRSPEAVTTALMTYLDPKKRTDSELPARNFWDSLPQDHARAAARSYVSKPAFPEDSARIRADFLRLVGNSEGAQRALTPRFKRNQLNDDIWITTGLMMLERHDAGEAARCFENAIGMGTPRPLPFVALAEVRLRAATVRHTGSGKLTSVETREIVALLREAAARPPALRETPLLLAELSEHAAEGDRGEIAAFVAAEAERHPYDTALFLACALRLARAGDLKTAAELISGARSSTMDAEALRQVALAEKSLTTPASNAPANAAVAARPVPTLPRESAPETGGHNFTVPELGLEMVALAPGRFRMGSAPGALFFKSDQAPATGVTIPHAFWIGRCEVTQGQWRQVMGTTIEQQRDLECRDLPLDGAGDELPVYDVSWHEADEFCRRLTERERAAGRITSRQEYRLPTEAQWEYACRAGSAEPVAANTQATAWLPVALPPHWAIPFNNSTYVPLVHPVGTKLPNVWGLNDLYGNVSEWCRDWYSPRLPGGEIIDQGGPTDGVFRVVRGGSCWGIEAGVPVIGAAVRSKDLPTARFARGFRVVLEPTDQPVCIKISKS